MAFFNFYKNTFKHGIHPPESKDETNGLPIRQFPFAPVIILPMAQHIGAPSQIVVREGQEVHRGQLLAKAGGYVSVPMHAPVSGIIRKIGNVPTISGKMSPGIFIEPFLLPARKYWKENRLISILPHRKKFCRAFKMLEL